MFAGVQLSWDQLNVAITGGANLRGVNVSGVDLSGLYLSGVDLSGVDLTHTKLDEAMLAGIGSPCLLPDLCVSVCLQVLGLPACCHVCISNSCTKF